jgi:hypothetical protein
MGISPLLILLQVGNAAKVVVVRYILVDWEKSCLNTKTQPSRFRLGFIVDELGGKMP